MYSVVPLWWCWCVLRGLQPYSHSSNVQDLAGWILKSPLTKKNDLELTHGLPQVPRVPGLRSRTFRTPLITWGTGMPRGGPHLSKCGLKSSGIQGPWDPTESKGSSWAFTLFARGCQRNNDPLMKSTSAQQENEKCTLPRIRSKHQKPPPKASWCSCCLEFANKAFHDTLGIWRELWEIMPYPWRIAIRQDGFTEQMQHIHAVTDVQSEKSKIRAFLSESIGVAWASSNGSRMEAAPWWRRIREMMQYPFGSYAADVWSKGLFMGWMLVEWMILTCWSSLNHGGRRPGQWCEKSWRTNG